MWQIDHFRGKPPRIFGLIENPRYLQAVQELSFCFRQLVADPLYPSVAGQQIYVFGRAEKGQLASHGDHQNIERAQVVAFVLHGNRVFDGDDLVGSQHMVSAKLVRIQGFPQWMSCRNRLRHLA